MRLAHVKTLRRMLLGLIVIVLVMVSVNYIQTWRRRIRVVQQATQILSTEMMRSADRIEYSEQENGTIRFKLRAERLLETKQGKNLLEGIEAFDYDPEGKIRNRIRSQRSEYDRDHRKASFSGNVRIQIGEGTELRTESLLYDQQANVGWTEDRLQLDAREVKGSARGVRYDHANKVAELKSECEFIVRRAISKQDGSVEVENIHAASERGYYSESELFLLLQGKARLESESAALSGDEIEASFSEDKKRITALQCKGNASYESKGASDSRRVHGDLLIFGIHPETGAVENIDVLGQAAFSSVAGPTEQDLQGSEIHLALDAAKGLPKAVLSRGNVRFHLRRDLQDTVTTGENLEAAFAAESNLLDKVRVWGEAQMTSQAAGDTGADRLGAQEIRIQFRHLEGRSVPQMLEAERSVKWESPPRKKTTEHPAEGSRTLSAAFLKLIYSSAGDYPESGAASGNVTLDVAPGTQPGATEIRNLRVDRVEFRFYPRKNQLKDFDASGNVQISYLKGADPAKGTQAQESHSTSDKARATFRESDGTAETVLQWGNFAYRDGSRSATSERSEYDARREVIVLRENPRITDASGSTTGETVTYDQERKVLSVQGRVRSVLKPKEGETSGPFASSQRSSSPSVVTADAMQYWTDDSRARYSGNVQLLSESGQLQAHTLDISEAGDRVEAEGDVRHLIPRRDAAPEKARDAEPVSKKDEKRASKKAPILICSSGLRYARNENAIHYSGGIVLQADDIRMSAQSVDAVLDSETNRIERAIAKGGLQVRQNGREASGEQGEYYLTPGKFVILGNLARIREPQRGQSFARRLTFFTADDRILLENR